MYLWTRSENNLSRTHQMHCYHFTPSLAVRAPRSSFSDIQRNLSGRFLPSILISPWWARTFLMLTPSNSQRRIFFGVKCIRNRGTHWTWITPRYLAKSKCTKAQHQSITCSSEPREDIMDTNCQKICWSQSSSNRKFLSRNASMRMYHLLHDALL